MRRMTKGTVTHHHGAVSLESFDFNLLRILDALLSTQSVSGAARQLRLSQPATSAALSRLRSVLHDPLLVRAGNQMLTTPLAEELRPRVTRILEGISETLTAAARFDPGTTRRRFRVGANDYTTLVVLIRVAEQLRLQAPHATLEILPLSEAPQVGLAMREMDLIVADRWTVRTIRKLEILFEESFVCIASAQHPRLSVRPTLEQFLAEPHALIAPHGVTGGVVDAALHAIGRSRQVALTVPTYLVAPAVIGSTDLVMTLPRRIVDMFVDRGRLRTFAPPIPLRNFEVALAADPRSIADPAVLWIQRLVLEIASGVRKASSRARVPR
jgi:DNA-binding transcriptional LysR family regulator